MTEEDLLLRELGRLERGEKESEKAHLDERWDRLAAGTITAEEEAELEALAETSPEAREALEAFRPLGAEFQARVVEAVAAEMRSTAEREAPREPRPRPSEPRREARRWGWWWMVPAAAAAAALLLLLRSPSPPSPLPVYTAELTGGIQAQRGGEPSALRAFVPGSSLNVVVRPAEAVADEIEVHAFLARGPEIEEWRPVVEVSDNGSVSLSGALGPDLPPGDWKVWVAVGRRGKIPPTAELLGELRTGRTRHDHWQAVSKDFRVEDLPTP